MKNKDSLISKLKLTKICITRIKICCIFTLQGEFFPLYSYQLFPGNKIFIQHDACWMDGLKNQTTTEKYLLKMFNVA